MTTSFVLHEDRKLGKKPAAPRKTDLMLAHYMTAAPVLPVAPVGYGHQGLVTDFGMLGNDSYGDCVWAGADHETMIWNAVAGKTVQFTPQNALGDYGAVTGFTPDDPNSDQGTDVHDALGYRRSTGVIDADGNRHKIAAFVSLQPGDWHELLMALDIFEAVGIGIEFPDYAMDEFNQGKPWAYHRGGTIEGGHYVPVVGRAHVSMLDVVTWGRVQPMTRSFFQHYCDEAWGILSEEMLTSDKSVEGFDLQQLLADVAAL